MSASASPVIILVEPQLGENIGMCARAMLNCGLDRLRLVRPRDGWPNPAALAGAADADNVIEQVECFDNVADAVADRNRVFAATARRRRLQIPALDLKTAVGEIHQNASSQSAVMFGPEASGLDNDALTHADRLIHFPINPEFSSLNLAQAVLLCGWEWWQDRIGDAEDPLVETSLPTPAEKGETAAFLTRLEDALDATGFFLSPEQRPDTVSNIRAIFTRSNPSSNELRMLHGVLTALTRNRDSDPPPS